MSNSPKYTMKMSLNVLNHLGLKLYSNTPSVLSEAVANAYDADATKVEVTLDVKKQKIIIKDNGHGMTVSEINDKYLFVGYTRRKNGEGLSRDLGRKVMGRKGIGKLSLFSIANHIEIVSKPKNGKVNGFRMIKSDIENQIKTSQVYHPKEIINPKFDGDHGTEIILTNFKRTISHSASWLKRRLARRFSTIGISSDFQININSDSIKISDRDYFSKVQFLWLIGEEYDYSKHFQFEKTIKLTGEIDGTTYKITGWIGAVSLPSDLQQDGVNNNKISIVCRNKMAQEDILESYTEGGIYADYLIGEINADFLDDDDKDDIATSSRQRIYENDERYIELQAHIYKILKKIQSNWTNYRKELNEKNAIANAVIVHPSLSKWFDSLKSVNGKKHAKELFATIESFHFDGEKSEVRSKKKDLYVQGIIAFERLRLKENLSALSKIKSAGDLRLSTLFNDLKDIEANLYYDIADERVKVIKEFNRIMNVNDKEKVLQEYLFDNLWLMNPSWERATSGTEQMEKTVEKALDVVVESLSEEEKKARFDIKYRTYTGKHIIIELKRYKPTYKITPMILANQIDKYTTALKKCLKSTEPIEPAVESIVVLGVPFSDEDYKKANDLLGVFNSRIIYYDQLIDQSLQAYSTYLEKQKQISKLRQIIDEVIDGDII